MKRIIPLLVFLLLSFMGACTLSGEVFKVPATNIAPVSTISSVSATKVPAATMVTGHFPTLEPSFLIPHHVDRSVRMGEWVLSNWSVDPITLTNSSNKAWQFSYSAYYGKEVLHTCTRLLYLTSDGQYLYFSLDHECILIEPFFFTSISVFRMNLVNGEVTEILEAVHSFESDIGNAYTVSISPTGRNMAYIFDGNNPLLLTLLDLQKGETRSFQLDEKYFLGGKYSWSEDGTKLAFMLINSPHFEDFQISMVFLDLLKEDSIVTFISDESADWMASMLEITADGIRISRFEEETLFYDIETGILSPVTP